MDQEFLRIERVSNGWPLVFQKLHQTAKTNAGTQLQAKKPMNIIRNRYRDVLPIDETRVKLNVEENDYINANFVKVEDVNRTYILTQGPLQHTCGHFWQMVWEQNTAGVVMLNKCVERGMNKCSMYWPDIDDQPMVFGQFKLENLGCEEESSYRLSHLKIVNLETSESRVVLHFHYTRWPDFGVPQTPDVFLEFLYAVRSSGVLGEDVGPCVIHCSAGIGRSGTFCLADVCLAKLEQTQDLSSLDVQTILLDMRKQRLGLIQTPDQLRFSYVAILQGAIQILGLENSFFEHEEEEEEEEESEESEEDELEESESEGEDEELRLRQKYPHLTRAWPQDVSDIPPPVPPRPPETFIRPSPPGSPPPPPDFPPPPPPTSLPPGPPRIHTFERGEDEQSARKRIKLEDESKGEEYGFAVAAGSESEEEESPEENGEVPPESESENEEQPPPIPPRSNSLTPEQSNPRKSWLYENDSEVSQVSRGGNNVIFENGTGHFLGQRGGGKVSPLENRLSEEDEGPPPPIPPKQNQRMRREYSPLESSNSIQADEQALISELNELEWLVSRSSAQMESTTKASMELGVQDEEQEQAAATKVSSSTELRRRERAEKKVRLTNQVQDMKRRLQQQKQTSDSEWAVPWLVVGFAAVIGYCAYYFFFS